MKIKRIGMLLSLGLLSLSIASLINDNKEISETSTQIRTIELDKNKIDEDNFFNTFVNSNLEINEEEIIFTGLKKLKDFNISYDNVSELILEEDYNEYMSFEYIYNKKSSILTLNAYQEDEAFIDDLECFIFKNADGEGDALICVEDEYLLLSDINEEYIENCGWFDKLVKSIAGVVAVAVAPVVALVSPTASAVVATVGTVTSMPHDFDTYDVVDKLTAFINRGKNKKQKEPTGYIYDQDDYSKFRFGFRSFSENGCGVVAAYNVLYGLGKRIPLSELIFLFDLQGGKVLGGVLGADPSYFPKLFNNYGFSCKSLSSYKGIREVGQRTFNSYTSESKEKWIIVCAWNGNSVFDGAHYVAAKISKEGKFLVYNNGTNKEDPISFNDFDDSIIGGDLIAAYIID
ncbi:MAG: hypothetical protein K5892_06315 [Acholeplasmatales bacterium]|nr:hypothetical protein [Acholeplasmatales bacterium]